MLEREANHYTSQAGNTGFPSLCCDILSPQNNPNFPDQI